MPQVRQIVCCLFTIGELGLIPQVKMPDAVVTVRTALHRHHEPESLSTRGVDRLEPSRTGVFARCAAHAATHLGTHAYLTAAWSGGARFSSSEAGPAAVVAARGRHTRAAGIAQARVLHVGCGARQAVHALVAPIETAARAMDESSLNGSRRTSAATDGGEDDDTLNVTALEIHATPQLSTKLRGHVL